jgi:hypothetical protein
MYSTFSTYPEVRLLKEILSVQRIIPYTKTATAIIEGRTNKRPPIFMEDLFLSATFIEYS